MHRVFLLSPAHCGGKRSALLFNDRAAFPLARRLHANQPVTLGEVFTFLSGLYFRGKLAYACRFAMPPEGIPPAWVITAGYGLLPSDTPVTLDRLRSFAQVPVDASLPAYRLPLERSAQRLADSLSDSAQVVLLGSIATGKYLEVVSGPLGSRLVFPSDFVGRGDMSRGGLMLRAVAAGHELQYVRLEGSVRRGKRPARLARAAAATASKTPTTAD